MRSAQDRAHTMETTVTELTAQLTDSKEKVSQLDAQVTHILFKKHFLILEKILMTQGNIHLRLNIDSIFVVLFSAEGQNRNASLS